MPNCRGLAECRQRREFGSPQSANSHFTLLTSPQNAELRRSGRRAHLPNPRSGRSREATVATYRMEALVESTTNILTIKEVADILRCSKTHAQNVIEGRVRG